MTQTDKISNLPNWPGASHCYSKAYRILESMLKRAYTHKIRPYYDWPSFDSIRLVEALNKGDEEEIKGLLLMNWVYYE